MARWSCQWEVELVLTGQTPAEAASQPSTSVLSYDSQQNKSFGTGAATRAVHLEPVPHVT